MSVTFALRDVYLNQFLASEPIDSDAQPWRRIGFNLDGYDTNPQTPTGSCRNKKSAYSPVDGVAGIDNVFGSVVGPALLGDGALERDLCCFQSRGVGTLLLRMTKWNGTANDATVEVSLLVAAAGTSEAPASVEWSPINNDPADLRGVVRTSDGLPANAPTWIPDVDTWYVPANEVENSNVDQGRHRDFNAYVVDRAIVMTLSSTRPVRLYLGTTASIAINLLDGHLLARMSSDFSQVDVGNMGGRMGATQLSEATQTLYASDLNNQSVCDGVVNGVAPVIDEAADVRTDPSLDRQDSTAFCDALSVGVSFHAIRAHHTDVAGQSLCFREPNCDGLPNPITCDPVNAIGSVCTYMTGTGCDLPAFVPSETYDAGP